MIISLNRLKNLNRKAARTVGVASLILVTAFGLVMASAMPAGAVNRSCSQSTNVAARPTLRQGDTGSCVRVAQLLLADRGLMRITQTTPDRFGPATHAAVLSVQRQAGITQDGIVGPQTWGVLMNSPGSPSTRTATPAPANDTSGLPAKCRTVAKSICIIKGTGSRAKLHAVQNRAIVRTLDARTGDPRGAEFATKEGTHVVSWKNKDHISSIYDVAMPYSMFFYGGQAIHYSENFKNTGYSNASHGCVNIRDYDGAAWLFNWTPTGARVVVTR